MKTQKVILITVLLIIASTAILFCHYTSFIDKLEIDKPAETDFIHPSELLIKYEVFVSGTILRPAYHNFVKSLNLTGNEKILDFGPGAGGEAVHLAEVLRDRKGSLTCLDISHTWLEVVKYRLSGYRNIEYIKGDIVNINIPVDSYDVIVMRLVLHDIPVDQRNPVISKLYRILKPGGSLFIYEPITTSHSIDENQMKVLFTNAGFNEKYFKKNFTFEMIPPRTMGMAAYDK